DSHQRDMVELLFVWRAAPGFLGIGHVNSAHARTNGKDAALEFIVTQRNQDGTARRCGKVDATGSGNEKGSRQAGAFFERRRWESNPFRPLCRRLPCRLAPAS